MHYSIKTFDYFECCNVTFNFPPRITVGNHLNNLPEDEDGDRVGCSSRVSTRGLTARVHGSVLFRVLLHQPSTAVLTVNRFRTVNKLKKRASQKTLKVADARKMQK
jgi:hypothetical protein